MLFKETLFSLHVCLSNTLEKFQHGFPQGRFQRRTKRFILLIGAQFVVQRIWEVQR